MRALPVLTTQLGRAPSLSRLYDFCPMAPMRFLFAVSRLAKSGRIVFDSSGHVSTRPAVLLEHPCERHIDPARE